MKKLFLLIALLIAFVSFSQNPARHTNGVIIGDPSGTSADPTGTKEGQIYWNSTLLKFRKFNGTTWSDLTVATVPNLQDVTDIGDVTTNSISINGTTTPNININNTSTSRSTAINSDNILFTREGFNLTLQSPALTGSYTLSIPALTENSTIALTSDIIASTNLLQEVVSPISVQYGTRLESVATSDGFYVDGTDNKGEGYLVKSNNNTGNIHYVGFSAEGYGATPFDNGFVLGQYGANHFATYLRDQTALYVTNDLKIIAARNTSDISFRLGNSATPDVAESSSTEVLSLASNRTITAPQLTNALITTGGDQSLVTNKYVTDNFAGVPLDDVYAVSWDGDITNSASRNAIYDKIEAILVTGGESTTVSDTAEIDLTLTGNDVTADIIAGSIDETKLDTSTNISLDLADTALQSEVDGSITNEIQTWDENVLSGTDLRLSLTQDAAVATIDLSPLQDGIGTDDQIASEVTNTASGNLTSTDVQASLVELQLDIDTRSVGAHTTDTNLTDEEVQDKVGAMVTTTNTETLIAVTYQDATADIDFVVEDDLSLYDNTTSNFSVGAHTSNTDSQNLTWVNGTNTMEISGGTNAVITGFLETEVDGSITNEIQDASEVAVSPAVNANTNVQSVLEDHETRIDNLVAGGGADGVVTNIELSGTTLIVDGTLGAETVDVDLSSLQDGFEANTDSQDLTLVGNTLAISGDPNTDVNLSGYLDNTDSQAISLNTNTLSITGNASTVDLSGYLDDTDTQLSQENVQDFVGSMVTGNTETLIAVTYDDIGNEFDFLVESDLSLYDNTTSNFSVGNHTANQNLTWVDGTNTMEISNGTNAIITGFLESEVDGSTTNEIQDLQNANTTTTHTLSIENGNGSLQLTEGTNVNLVTSGTAQDAIVTINATQDGTGTDDQNLILTGDVLTIENGTGSVDLSNYDNTLSQENVQDFVGSMVTGNTETRIAVTYDDTNNEFDFVVEDDLSLYDNTTSGFLTLVTSSDITNNTIQEIDLEVTNTGTNNQILSLDTGTGGFTWVNDANTQLSTENVQDAVGGMVTGNTETRIAVTYDDTNNEFDFVVDDMIQTASQVTSTATGSISSTNVQSAIAELENEIDITTNYIAYGTGDGITGTSDFQYSSASDQLTIRDGGLGSDVNIDIGKSALESLNIGAYADALNTTVDYIEFTSKTESTATDAGEFRFNVDGVADKLIINDFGINVGGLVSATEFNTLDTSGDKFKIGFNTGIGRDYSGQHLYLHTNTGQDILLGGSVGGVQNDVIIKSGNLTVGTGTQGTKTLNITGDAEISTDAQVLGKLAVGIATGSTAQLHVEFSNALTSNAGILIEQNSTGDATTTYNVPAASYTLGIDNSNADKFVLSSGTALGTSDRMVVDSNGITATDFILTSDRRLKENIQDYSVKHIPVRWRTFDMKEDGSPSIGVIADELEKTNPEFVNKGETPEDMDSVKYIKLLIAKVAELESRIKELENK